MNATLSKKLRFSDVVYAIGATPKSVRLWLQRGLVEINTLKPEDGGWTEYSFRDIAILALVRALVNFGVDVPSASNIANTIMGEHFFPELHHIKNPDAMPAGALAVMWSNIRLHLYRDGDDWRMNLAELWASELGRRPDFDPELPSGVAALRREHEPAPVYLSIDVETVLRTAFERANESVNDGADVGGTE